MAGDMGMFGGPIGTRLAEQDMANLAMQGAQYDELRGKTARIPFQIEQDAAQSRLLRAQAEAAETKTSQARRMAELFANSQGAALDPNKPATGGNILDAMANAAAGAGDLTKAGVLYSQAARIRSNEASVVSRQARAAKDALATERGELDQVERFFGDVKDQSGWENAALNYMTLTGKQAPFAGQAYSPELVEALKSSVLSRKDKIAFQLRETEADERGAHREAQEEAEKAKQRVREAAQKTRQEREDRLAKAGGKVGRAVGVPSAREQDDTGALIKRDFPNLSAEDRKDAAYSVAARARELRNRNPALNPETARQQALSEAIKNGDLVKETGVLRDTHKFLGRGKSADTAAALPARDKLVADRYYITSKGTAKYLGDGKFSLVPKEAAAEADDDDDDQDEDD